MGGGMSSLSREFETSPHPHPGIIKFNCSFKTLNCLFLDGRIGKVGGAGDRRRLKWQGTSSCRLIIWPTWELCKYFLRWSPSHPLPSPCDTRAGLILSNVGVTVGVGAKGRESRSRSPCQFCMHAAGGKRRSGWWSTSEDKEFGKSQLSVRLHVENLSSSCLAHKNGVKHRILPGEGEGNQGGVRASGNEWLRGGGTQTTDCGTRNTEWGLRTTDRGQRQTHHRKGETTMRLGCGSRIRQEIINYIFPDLCSLPWSIPSLSLFHCFSRSATRLSLGNYFAKFTFPQKP